MGTPSASRAERFFEHLFSWVLLKHAGEEDPRKMCALRLIVWPWPAHMAEAWVPTESGFGCLYGPPLAPPLPLQRGGRGPDLWRGRRTIVSCKSLLRFSICACHPCEGAMLIFSVSFQFYRICNPSESIARLAKALLSRCQPLVFQTRLSPSPPHPPPTQPRRQFCNRQLDRLDR